MEVLQIPAFILPWFVVGLLGWLLQVLVRQHGRTLLLYDGLQARLATLDANVQALAKHDRADLDLGGSEAPLRIGSPVPGLRLPDLYGRERTLEEFVGAPLLLVFFNPDCGFCAQMAPRLGQLPAGGTRVVLVSRGDPGRHRRLVEEHGGRCDVLLDSDGGAASLFQANGTPMGYLVDSEGTIASVLTAGADALLDLVSESGAPAGGHAADLSIAELRAKEHHAVERAKAAGLGVRESTLQRNGLPPGSPAPDFRLPDLEDRERSLAEFRGQPLLLVFSDPGCGPCQALAPDLAKLQAAVGRASLQIVMVSRGDLETNRAKAREHGIDFPVLRQRQWEISRQFAMFATPVAYLIDERGVIAREVAVGGDAIMQLVSTR